LFACRHCLLFAKRIAFQTPWPVRMVEPPRPIIVAIEGERPPERHLEHRACAPPRTLH
jgi:hypothetical protein